MARPKGWRPGSPLLPARPMTTGTAETRTARRGKPRAWCLPGRGQGERATGRMGAASVQTVLRHARDCPKNVDPKDSVVGGELGRLPGEQRGDLSRVGRPVVRVAVVHEQVDLPRLACR